MVSAPRLQEWEVLAIASLIFGSCHGTQADSQEQLSEVRDSTASRAVTSFLEGASPVARESQSQQPPAQVEASYEAVEEASRLFSHALHRVSRLKQLRPFQRKGVLRALELGGRCLLADEMGCGKTPQALAILASFSSWPALIICPASLRLVWAEELEKWLPEVVQPRNVHIIFSSNDMLPQSRQANSLGDIRIVIVSFAMARLLFENLSSRAWGIAVVDESHALRMSGGRPTSAAKAVLTLLQPIPRLILLSGTPSASNYLDVYAQADALCPGLFGKSWHVFSKDYDDPTLSSSGHLGPGRCRRPNQLAFLLREKMMIRRLKRDVLAELPSKRRRTLKLALSSETSSAFSDAEASALTDYEVVGLLKAVAAETWLRERLRSFRVAGEKVVVFAHHIRVLDRICKAAEVEEVPLIRIDGSTPPLVRQSLVHRFKEPSAASPTLAVIGVTACAVGVDLSAASLAVFVELPPDISWLLQAEDRLHRRGQKNPVDIVVLLAQSVPSSAGRPSQDAAMSEKDVARCCDGDAFKWRALQRRHTEVVSLHDSKIAGASRGGEDSQGPDNDEADVHQAFCQRLQSVGQQSGSSSASSESGSGFAFEASAYSDRLHVYHDGFPLGCTVSISPDLESERLYPTDFQSQLADFRAAWQGLSPYQRRMAKGQAQTAEVLTRPSSKMPVTEGCRKRYLVRRHSGEGEEADAPSPKFDGEYCEVAVLYRTGRLSGQKLSYYVAVQSSQVGRPPQQTGQDFRAACEQTADIHNRVSLRLLCMECREPLEGSHGEQAQLLSEAKRGPGGSKVAYRLDRSADGSEVELFCTGTCRGRFFAKRSGWSIRRQLFELERGVCQCCGLDCHALLQELLVTSEAARRAARLTELAPRISATSARAARILAKPTEGFLWEADHILPVWEGGGACGLENLQTLCVACHEAKTRAEATRRSAKKADATDTAEHSRGGEATAARHATASAAPKRKGQKSSEKKVAVKRGAAFRQASSQRLWRRRLKLAAAPVRAREDAVASTGQASVTVLPSSDSPAAPAAESSTEARGWAAGRLKRSAGAKQQPQPQQQQQQQQRPASKAVSQTSAWSGGRLRGSASVAEIDLSD
eukprot:TRINITY_DN22553_c0_g1_i2.p1 TRINITY_DN22553_c0_g1~~TRINITY_DN22553_c0_g1_i2.p1  ORF type:complete len:1101 (-),score=183.88 TRINITY_DN22553_c0_g1_i2:52-3354(-)